MPARPLMLSAFRVSAATLRESPLRTFLSTLGIVIGVGSLVSVLALSDGMERFIRAEIGAATDLQAITLAPRTSRDVDGTTVPLADTLRFTDDDAQSLRATLRDSIVIGFTARGVGLSSANGRQHVVRLLGITANLLPVLHLTIPSGEPRPTNGYDKPLLLLSANAAQKLSADSSVSLRPGDSVDIGRQRYAVSGVLAREETDRTLTAVMSVAMAEQAAVPGSLPPPAIAIYAPRLEEVDTARVRIEAWLGRRYGRSWQERVSLITNASSLAYAQRGILLFKLLMGAITSISLLVGGIGVMNVLLAAIAERTREIGVRRAVGASRGHIIAQFLAEAVTISGLGSAAGIALGLALSYGISAVLRAKTGAAVHAVLSTNTVIIAVAATVVVGLVFGIYPALRASLLDPVDAMRHD